MRTGTQDTSPRAGDHYHWCCSSRSCCCCSSVFAASMLRSLHALGASRVLLCPVPVACGVRAYAKEGGGGGGGSNGKVSVRDAPVATSNIGRMFNKNFRKERDRMWAKKKAESNLKKSVAGRLRKLGLLKEGKHVAFLAKKKAEHALNADVKVSATKVAVRKKKYDQATKQDDDNAEEDEDDDDGRPGDYLFRYAKYNLGEHGLARPVAPPIMEAMYRLFSSDEDFWTPTRLGTKFGFSYEMSTGIILLKSVEKLVERKHEQKLQRFYKSEELRKLQCQKDRKVSCKFAPKKKPVNHLLSDVLERAMGQEFGWMSTEGVAPKPPGAFGLFSDIALVGDQFDMGLLARASFKVAPPPYELPEKPPNIFIPPRIISGPTRINKFFRSRLLIVDIEKKSSKDKAKDDQRFMMIRELDGTLRTPSWQERVDIQHHYIRRHGSKMPKQVTDDPLGYYSYLRPPHRYPGRH